LVAALTLLLVGIFSISEKDEDKLREYGREVELIRVKASGSNFFLHKNAYENGREIYVSSQINDMSALCNYSDLKKMPKKENWASFNRQNVLEI